MNQKSQPQSTATASKAAQAFSKMTTTPWLAIMLFVFVCIALYFNSLSNGFVYDDYAIIVENKYIQHPVKSFPSFFNHSYFNIVTISRNRDWKDNFTLWSKTVITTPDSSIAHGSLGRAYQDRGQLDEAIQQYRKVTELDPDDFEARNNLGVAYAKQGKLDKAIVQWEKVLEMDPQNKSAGENIRKAKEMMD